MKIIKVKDQVEGGKEALKVFKEALDNEVKVFGLATGSTPETTYDELVKSDIDFSSSISVNLDEYVGLKPEDEQSYAYFMKEHLFNAKPFAKSFLPNGIAEDADQECERYDKLLEEYHVGLQLLGIGRNGHIGFNEPGSSFDSKTHKVALTQSTINANSRFFDNEEDVPKYAYSMGIGTIMKSDTILLEAFGKNKAEAVKAMIEGPVTPEVPASVLQNHPDVVVIIDEEAASLLK